MEERLAVRLERIAQKERPDRVGNRLGRANTDLPGNIRQCAEIVVDDHLPREREHNPVRFGLLRIGLLVNRAMLQLAAGADFFKSKRC